MILRTRTVLIVLATALAVVLTMTLLISVQPPPTLVSPRVPSVLAPIQDTGPGSLLSNQLNVITPKPTPVPAKVMAWLFPSRIICSSQAEYSDGRQIDFLKPEYFTVTEGGALSLLTETRSGCNGYSAANAESIREHSTYQFVTVSSAVAGMQNLTSTPASRSAAIEKLTDFVVTNDFTGIEIDFEEFSGWEPQTYQNYLAFLRDLAVSLHAKGKQLMVDVPPIGSPLEQSYYALSYQDIVATDPDYVVVMAYDSQYDQGAGTPIAPDAWVSSVVTWAKRYVPLSKLVLGIPSYAYSGPTESYDITRVTYNDLKTVPGFTAAQRDPASAERTFIYDGKSYVYTDSTSLDAKRALIESYGVRYISVWALGGNPWFTK